MHGQASLKKCLSQGTVAPEEMERSSRPATKCQVQTSYVDLLEMCLTNLPEQMTALVVGSSHPEKGLPKTE